MRWVPCIAWLAFTIASWFGMGYVDSHWFPGKWWSGWACVWLLLQTMCGFVLTISCGGMAWAKQNWRQQ